MVAFLAKQPWLPEKSTIKSKDALYVENAIYSVLHKKKNIDASFTEHPENYE